MGTFNKPTRLIDFLFSNEEVVVLSAYNVPEMGDVIQYIVIKFSLSTDHDQTNFSPSHSATLPYSIQASLLQQSPRLEITSDLAYIYFRDSVVIVSLSPKSTYESYIALNNPNDDILFTCAKADQSKQTNTAYVFTLSSGVIEITTDIADIQTFDIG